MSLNFFAGTRIERPIKVSQVRHYAWLPRILNAYSTAEGEKYRDLIRGEPCMGGGHGVISLG